MGVLGIGITVMITITLLAAGLLVWKVRHEGIGLRIKIVGTAILVSKNCPDCSGGVQALYHNDPARPQGYWGPIAIEHRMISDLSPFVESPITNRRTCTECQGKGFNWVEKKLRHNYMPPNTGMLDYAQKKWVWPWVH